MALSEFLPILFLGPLFGVLVDRLHRKTLAFIAHVFNFLLVSSLFVLVWLDVIDIYLLFAVTMGLGVVSAAFQPVRLSLIPSLVPDGQLAPAGRRRNPSCSTCRAFWGLRSPGWPSPPRAWRRRSP